MTLRDTIRERKIIVCCGSGGVGKTTAAAAVAMAAAADGLNVIVLTIDPAKRLANSLGLSELGNDARQVPAEKFAEAGIEITGTLWAMMLDTKGTFDELVEKYAVDPEVAAKVLNNELYQNLSGALAGSQEYMAMEKLYELYRAGEYDLIVLDTPPTRHALDFLDAPKRMTDFLDGSILQWFLKPYFSVAGKGIKSVQRGTQKLLQLLEKVTGLTVLKIVSEFFIAFEGMYDGFKERAAEVSKILRSRNTAFLLVTSPEDLTLEEAIYFYTKLKEYRMPFVGFIVNKVHENYLARRGLKSAYRRVASNPEEVDLVALAESESESRALERLTPQLVENFGNFTKLAEADALGISRLEEMCVKNETVISIPYFSQDIYDIRGLALINDYLFGSKWTTGR